MFCSDCGKPAQGKFCSHCGHRLTSGDAVETPAVVRIVELTDSPALPIGPALPDRWEDEVRYEALLQLPRVREIIHRHAGMAQKKLSGEDFLKLCDKVMPMGVPLEKLALLVQPLYARLGIATGKERVGRVPAPVGRVMLRALCSLARRGQALRVVKQAEDGCFFEAQLPSDMFALDGELLVGVRRVNEATEVMATTQIRGQFFDWGKSRRCLDALFADLDRDAA